jgi:hypothetical protein
MYGCCSTECATIIHLLKRRAYEKRIKNGNKIFKKENQISCFSKNNADPLAAIPT